MYRKDENKIKRGPNFKGSMRKREREREEESDLNERKCVYVLNETETEREVPSVNNLRGWSI